MKNDNFRKLLQNSMACMAVTTCVMMIPLSYAQPSSTPAPEFWRPDGPVLTMALTAERVYLGGQFNYVGPYTGGAGVVDSDSGAPSMPFPAVVGVVTSAASDGQGGWFIGGQFTKVGGLLRNNLAHVLADGSVNVSWDPSPDGTNNVIVLANNRLYVGGAFTKIGGLTRNRAAALDPATGRVLEWNPNCAATVHAIEVSGNSVYLGGTFTKVGNQTRNRLAAVDSVTGSVLAWNPSASGGGNAVYAIAVNGSKVYVGGSFTTLGTKARNNIGVVDASSNVADNWNPNANGIVRTLLGSGNLVYAGGEFTSIGAQNRNRLAALDAEAGVATDWDPNVSGPVLAMRLSGSTLYIGGSFATVGSTARLNLASIDVSTGAVGEWTPAISTFGASAHRIYALALGSNSICLGGDFTSFGGVLRKNAAAFDLATGAATDWDPKADGSVNVLVVESNAVYAGGTFTTVGGQNRNCLAALDAETGLVLDWNPVVIGKTPKVSALAFSSDAVFVGGVFTNVGSAKRSGLAKISRSTGSAIDWDLAPEGVTSSTAPAINSLLLSGDRLYVAGDFAKLRGTARLRLGAVDARLPNVLDWNPGASNPVLAMVQVDNIMMVGGSFTNAGGLHRTYVAAIDTSTGTATTWNPGPNKAVHAIAVAGNSAYVGGDFTSIGGEFRNRLALVSFATGQSGEWDPNMNGIVRSLVVTPGAVYAGGDFTTVGGQSHRYFAVFPKRLGFLSTAGSTVVTPAGTFEAKLQVADGQRVIIQASTDLINWSNIQTNVPAGTEVRLKDPAPGTLPYRFYRAILE